MKTRFSGIGGLVAVGAVVVGFGAGCDGLEPGDEAEGVEQTSSELVTFPTQFTLRNYQTRLCLGVAAGNPNPGSKMVVWNCDGTANQNFQAVNIGDGYWTQVKNMVGTNRCLDMTRGQYVTYTNGTTNDIDLCDKTYPIYWHLMSPSNDAFGVPPIRDAYGHTCYQFMGSYGPTNKPLVMGVSGGNTAPGTAVIMWETFNSNVSHPDQYWCIY